MKDKKSKKFNFKLYIVILYKKIFNSIVFKII
jgi:hypothetical protein